MTARETMEDAIDYFRREMEDLQAQYSKLAVLHAGGEAKRQSLMRENAILRLEIIELKKAIESKKTSD